MSTNSELVKVWDPLVRIFRWSLVCSFLIAFISEDDFINVHVIAGYALLGLIAIRIFWGLMGSTYARFSNFIYSPHEIVTFLKDTSTLRAKRYIGHNPAGGAMIILLLTCLIITGLTGFAVYGAEDQLGPMSELFQYEQGFWAELFEDIHEFFANLCVFLIVIHIIGVVAESVIYQENLTRSMINGLKKLHK